MPQLLQPDPASRFLKGQIVGWTGNGKTSLMGTCADVPEMSPVVALDAEGGLLSVQHRGDIYEERVKNSRHFDEIFWKLANGDKDWVAYKTVVLDSATELVAATLEEISAREFKRSSEPNSKRAKRDSIDDIQLKDYGTLTKQCRRQFRWLKDLEQRHILFSSLPQNIYPQPPGEANSPERKDFEENIKRGVIRPLQVVPAFTQRLGDAINGFTDFNWFLQVVPVRNGGPVPKMQRRLITAQQPPYYFVKTRGSKFAALLGSGVDVDETPGESPTIKGIPAMRYVYDAYVASLQGGVQ